MVLKRKSKLMITATNQLTGGRGEARAWPQIHLPLRLTWTTLGLGLIVLLAAILRLYNIQSVGNANEYYTAAVKSMLQSFSNFFFAAAEPGGSVTVDKPALGLWLQAISALIFGMSGVAVVLPQVIAGILSVPVLFHLVRRYFGATAGLVAAFALVRAGRETANPM
jgi:4-amino-4-deoxy-L-arabinose transferase-like glycosyltransferase